MKHHPLTNHLTCFPRRWLAVVLTQCRAVGGLLHLLRTDGGLSPHYTQMEGGRELSLEHFLRIEVNKAMLQDYEEFMTQWDELGRQIYDFGYEHGDEFNKQYKRNKHV